MGQELEFVTPLHKKTKRDHLGRMLDNKVACMEVASRFEKDFWDGDRKYGYGGYHYDGRWQTVAQKLIDHYSLPSDARLLDVGCGKGYLIYELLKLLPQASVVGMDISSYAIENAHPQIKDCLIKKSADTPYPFSDNEFDLVISLTTLHNLPIFGLKSALQEIERVGKQKYILVEGYRDHQELFNLQCWALTCDSFYRPNEWQWLFKEYGYTGDFEFIYF